MVKLPSFKEIRSEIDAVGKYRRVDLRVLISDLQDLLHHCKGYYDYLKLNGFEDPYAESYEK